MKYVALLLLLAASPVVADECDTQAARLVKEVGAAVRRRTGSEIALHHPETSRLSLKCRAGRLVGVAGTRQGTDPIDGFAQLIVATSGRALRVSEKVTDDVILACLRESSRRPGRFLDASGGGIMVKCALNFSFVAIEIARR